jgi:hypothetical protein
LKSLFADFHGLGVNFTGSCQFLQSRKTEIIPENAQGCLLPQAHGMKIFKKTGENLPL